MYLENCQAYCPRYKFFTRVSPESLTACKGEGLRKH